MALIISVVFALSANIYLITLIPRLEVQGLVRLPAAIMATWGIVAVVWLVERL